MNQELKSGFATIMASGKQLDAHGFGFAVLIEHEKIKAYLVNKPTWESVLKSHEVKNNWYDEDGYTPVMVLNNSLIETAQQLNWLIVGELED